METDNERDLGVQLSKNLKWSIQVKNAANRAVFHCIGHVKKKIYVLEL